METAIESGARLCVELLRRRPVSGGMIFDLQLVATMQANSVRSVYTFNRADFEVFSELNVITPTVS